MFSLVTNKFLFLRQKMFCIRGLLSALRDDIWKCSLSETWNDMWTSNLCASLEERILLNKMDGLQLCTYSMYFITATSRMISHRGWLLLASQRKMDCKLFKVSMTDKWTDGQKLGRIPRLFLAGSIIGALPVRCPAWNEEAQLKRCTETVPSPQKFRTDSTKRQTAGLLGEACTISVPVLHSYPRLSLLRSITWWSLTKKYSICLKVIMKHYNDDHRHIGTYSIKYLISIKNLCQTKSFNPCCRVTFSVVFVLLVVFWKPWTMPEMHNGPAKPSKSAK